MATAFDDKDFADVLDRYGSDSSRWPESCRKRALAWLASSPGARALLDEAQRLDAALDAVFTVPPVPVGLRTRTLAVTGANPTWLDWLTTKAWRPLSLACVPLILGFWTGLNYTEDTMDLEEGVLAVFTETEFVDVESWDL